MIKPVRIQLRRTKGFQLQLESRSINGLPAVKCARPGKWGNPFKAIDKNPRHIRNSIKYFRSWLTGIRCDNVMGWAFGVSGDPKSDPAQLRLEIGELRGKNLACFCKIGDPCHCDVLLEIANAPEVA